jgi:uncharacterized protein YjiK
VRRPGTWVALLAAATAGAACGKSPATTNIAADSLVMSERAARLDAALSHPDSIGADEPIARWQLPSELNEISGLALTADGRLLTHGDERGKVFEVDYRRGVVVKEFTVGSTPVHGDFESITVAGNTVLLLTSGGVIYQFPEGSNGAAVQFAMRDTGLGDECEFEGMAFDSTANLLLLACKRVHDKALKDSLVIFRLPLAPGTDAKQKQPPHLAVSMAKVVGTTGWDGFHPSDLTIDPFSGNYVLVAAREKALVEITPVGDVVFARALPPDHQQAEGVAITRDHILMISDEAKGGPATITLYRWRP